MTRGVCLITGASRGIGAACASQAAAAGYDVVVNYLRDEASAKEVAGQVIAAGQSARTVKGDVSRPEDIETIFSAADETGLLAAFINNAGVVDVSQRVDEMSPERLQRMFAINTTGAMLCAAAAVRRMSTRHGGGGGNIVNVSSAAARLGSPGQYVDYAAAKAAIDAFTKGLSLEVAAEGIRVNAVRPGIIDTDIHASGGQPDRVAQLRGSVPMGREGSTGEVANVIMWLLSDSASYVTGAIVDVAGGR